MRGVCFSIVYYFFCVVLGSAGPSWVFFKEKLYGNWRPAKIMIFRPCISSAHMLVPTQWKSFPLRDVENWEWPASFCRDACVGSPSPNGKSVPLGKLRIKELSISRFVKITILAGCQFPYKFSLTNAQLRPVDPKKTKTNEITNMWEGCVFQEFRYFCCYGVYGAKLSIFLR